MLLSEVLTKTVQAFFTPATFKTSKAQGPKELSVHNEPQTPVSTKQMV